MKTILYVYHVSVIGGGSYCLLNIVRALDRSIYNPIVLLSRRGTLSEELEMMGVMVIILNDMRAVPYNSSCFTIKNLSAIYRIIRSRNRYIELLKQINPDIVYINSMMLYPFLRWAKKSGFKCIIHIREHWEKTGHKIQRELALRTISKYANEIIAINEYSKSMFVQYGRTPMIIYDWIDMDKRYESKPLNELMQEDCYEKKVFLFLGGIQEIKGTYEVFKIFNEISNPNYRLLAIGINSNLCFHDTSIKGYVKRLLKSFHLETYSMKVLRIISKDPRIKCIPGLYNLTHIYEQVYCNLSYYTTPHANLSLAESIITGCVSIAAETSESIEYSDQGRLAILYQMNDSMQFKKSILELDKYYGYYKEKLAKYSIIVKEKFDPIQNIKKMNFIYERL